MAGIQRNRDAYYKYEVKDTYEAGIELLGWEVNSIKHGNISLQGSYVKPLGNELYLVNAHVPVPTFVTTEADPLRSRRLLLKRAEITELLFESHKKGLTIIPLRIYTTRGKVKLEVALGKGKRRFEQEIARKKKTQEKKLKQDLKDSGF